MEPKKILAIAIIALMLSVVAYAQGGINDFVQNVFFNNSGANNVTTNIFVNNNQTSIYQNYTVNQTISSNLTSNTTNDLAEGSNNLYYTNARVFSVGNNTYIKIGNATACNAITGKLNWNATYNNFTCDTDQNSAGVTNESVDFYSGNAANLTGTLSKSVMPANVNYNNSEKVRVYGTTPDDLTNNVPTMVIFNTEQIDTTNAFANNNFTAQNTGWYHIYANVQFANIIAGHRYIVNIYLNGEPYSEGNTHAVTGAASYITSSVEDFIQLNAGDKIAIYVISESGDNSVDINKAYLIVYRED